MRESGYAVSRDHCERGGQTIDGFEGVSGFGEVTAGLALVVEEGVVDAVLVEEEGDDLDSAKGGGEVEGRGARGRGVNTVGRDGAVGEKESDRLRCNTVSKSQLTTTHALEAHRTARWRAAAEQSRDDTDRSLPISARKGWIRAGSPATV